MKDIRYRMRPGRYAVLKELRDYRANYGISPTLVRLAGILDCSRQAVHQHIQRLVEAGLVEKHRGVKYRVTGKGEWYVYTTSIKVEQ